MTVTKILFHSDQQSQGTAIVQISTTVTLQVKVKP